MLIYQMYCLGFHVYLLSLNVNVIASLLPYQILQLLSCFIPFICLRGSSKISLFQKLELCMIGLDHLSVVVWFLLTDSAERESEMLLILNPQTVWSGGRTQPGVNILFWKHTGKAAEENIHRHLFLLFSWLGLFYFYFSNFIVE